METELERLVDYLEKVLREREDRILLSIASIPGGGKSTLAFLLAQSLNRRDQRAKVVGLDGWHYSKAQLEQFPDPVDARFRRGAEDTFDAESYADFIKSLSGNIGTKGIPFPTFSHLAGDPIPPPLVPSSSPSSSVDPSYDSNPELLKSNETTTTNEAEAIIRPSHRLIIVEGLYTQLSTPRWKEASEAFDERWRIEVRREVARERLIARHLRTGVCGTEEEATIRVDKSDLPNGDFLIANSLEPTRFVRSIDDVEFATKAEIASS